MVVKLIIFLLLLLGAAWVGWEIHQDPGYVLINFRNSQIEMTLWAAILILIILFFVLYFLLRLIVQSSHWPSRWREHNRTKALHQAHQTFEMGCCELIEEKWHSAEEHFRQCANVIPKPFIYYAAAGIAADRQGAASRRDSYLKKAWQIAPEAEITVSNFRGQTTNQIPTMGTGNTNC